MNALLPRLSHRLVEHVRQGISLGCYLQARSSMLRHMTTSQAKQHNEGCMWNNRGR
jgi:hypothetical protein